MPLKIKRVQENTHPITVYDFLPKLLLIMWKLSSLATQHHLLKFLSSLSGLHCLSVRVSLKKSSESFFPSKCTHTGASLVVQWCKESASPTSETWAFRSIPHAEEQLNPGAPTTESCTPCSLRSTTRSHSSGKPGHCNQRAASTGCN